MLIIIKKMELKEFIKFLFLSILINGIKNQCDKEHPIFYNNDCIERYCTAEEFENGICTINNNIAKIQWLNKVDSFSKNNVNGFVYIKMSNNDIFFICTAFEENNSIYAYGLKSTGEKYYNDENAIGYKMFNSIELESLNIIKLKIENKEYPLICSKTDCELIDFENNNAYSAKIVDFMNNIIDGEEILYMSPDIFPILNLNQENKILFITLVKEDSSPLNFNFTLGGSKISSKDLSEFQHLETFNNDLNIKREVAFKRLNCFITEKGIIECFYNDESKFYKVAIFEENFNYNKSIILDNQEIIYDDDYTQYMNCIQLKKEIGVY